MMTSGQPQLIFNENREGERGISLINKNRIHWLLRLQSSPPNRFVIILSSTSTSTSYQDCTMWVIYLPASTQLCSNPYANVNVLGGCSRSGTWFLGNLRYLTRTWNCSVAPCCCSVAAAFRCNPCKNAVRASRQDDKDENNNNNNLHFLTWK